MLGASVCDGPSKPASMTTPFTPASGRMRFATFCTTASVRSTEARSTLVAGVYSTRPGFVGSERDWDVPPAKQGDEMGTYDLEMMAAQFDEVPLAVVGIVPCKVSAENGPIRPGDLLVTAGTVGHAMRDDNPKTGSVLGKALDSLPSGTGVIRILVTLH